jgi:hypothetical protein
VTISPVTISPVTISPAETLRNGKEINPHGITYSRSPRALFSSKNLLILAPAKISKALRQAIRELCGVSDGNDGQLKEEIAHISKTGK